MKHQISLVGGQPMPVYLGIKEFEPEKVHLVCSKESKRKMGPLKKMVTGLKFGDYEVDAFDFSATKQTIEKILDKLDSADEILFNLTGGTKVMVLAAQAVLLERDLKGIYINQNNTYLNLPEYTKSNMKSQLLIDDFLKLSGHSTYSSKKLEEYNPQDIKAINEIKAFSGNNRYKQSTEHVRNNFKNIDLSKGGAAEFERGGKKIKCIWTNNTVEMLVDGKSTNKFISDKVLDLFFNAGWWELVVARGIAEKLKVHEMLLKVELPYIVDNTTGKSEIDILINNHNKLIFIECKSGTVKQEDITKMRVIKETYGGLVSKSVLVTQFPLSAPIKERCDELGIEVIIAMQHKFEQLVTTITKLEKTASL